MTDPNLQWDGTRWLRWDGQQWIDAVGPVVEPPTKNSTPLREVPPATVNDYAGLKPNDSWQPLFTTCAQLAGGLS